MYLIHKWWARKPHNVVAEYIEHYSKKGEVVLDPFCGSGVTIVEALRAERLAIGVDLNPMAVFITRMTVLPASIKKLKSAFERIEGTVKDDIESLYVTRCPKCGRKARTMATIWDRESDKPTQLRLYCEFEGKKFRKAPTHEDLEFVRKLSLKKPEFWYPKDKLYYPDGKPFKKKEINETVADLYTNRGLIALSMIWHQIETIEVDDRTRDFLRFWFTSRAHIASKMTPVAKPSPRAHWTEDSTTSFWAIQSFWVPPRYMESNAWMVFESGFNGPQGLIKGKEESNAEVGEVEEAESFEKLKNDGGFLVINKSAISFEEIPSDSVDYCFTDPPYGGSIQYFELCTLWLSWLRGSDSEKRFKGGFQW